MHRLYRQGREQQRRKNHPYGSYQRCRVQQALVIPLRWHTGHFVACLPGPLSSVLRLDHDRVSCMQWSTKVKTSEPPCKCMLFDYGNMVVNHNSASKALSHTRKLYSRFSDPLVRELHPRTRSRSHNFSYQCIGYIRLIGHGSRTCSRTRP